MGFGDICSSWTVFKGFKNLIEESLAGIYLNKIAQTVQLEVYWRCYLEFNGLDLSF